MLNGALIKEASITHLFYYILEEETKVASAVISVSLHSFRALLAWPHLNVIVTGARMMEDVQRSRDEKAGHANQTH